MKGEKSRNLNIKNVLLVSYYLNNPLRLGGKIIRIRNHKPRSNGKINLAIFINITVKPGYKIIEGFSYKEFHYANLFGFII